MKAYIGQENVYGSWMEDLDSINTVLNTMDTIGRINEDGKLHAILVILKGDELKYYASKENESAKLRDSGNLLHQLYIKAEIISAILNKC